MTDDQKEILIDGFLAGTLSRADKQLISQLVREDSVFRNELKRAKTAKDLLLLNRSRNVIDEEFKKYSIEKSQTSTTKSSTLNVWKIAASLLVLALAGFGTYYYFSADDNRGAMAARAQFQPYAIVESIPTMGAESDEAYREYERGHYNAAIAKFQRMLKDPGAREHYLRFYLANAQIATNHPEEAKQNLLTILESNETFPLRTQVKWYLVLSYLMLHDDAHARPLIDELLTDDQYRKKASALKQTIYGKN